MGMFINGWHFKWFMTPTALLGLHEPPNLRACNRKVRELGYQATPRGSLAEMTAEAQQQRFDLYVMDANLDQSGAVTIAPLETQLAIPLVQESLEHGGRLYVITGHSDTLALATAYFNDHPLRAQLHAVLNTNLYERLRLDLSPGNTTS